MEQKLDKRLAVSEKTWKELGKLKEAGETYNELLQEMIQSYNRMELAKKMQKVEELDEKELVALDEL